VKRKQKATSCPTPKGSVLPSDSDTGTELSNVSILGPGAPPPGGVGGWVTSSDL